MKKLFRFISVRIEITVAIVLLGLTLPAHGALSDGLISFWPFEEASGGLTPDVISDNDLSMVGNPVIGQGRRGSGLILNGTTSYLTNYHSSDPAITGLPIYPTGTYTVAMWVKGPPQMARYLFAEGNTANNNPLFIIQTGQVAANNALLDVIIRNDTGGAAGTPINHRVSTSIVFDNEWHHIVWVDDAGDVRLYIDGVLDGTDFSYTPVGDYTMNTTSVGTLARAAISTGAIFNGSIDDLSVWRRALTEGEVGELFATGLPFEGTQIAPTLDAPLASASVRVGDWHLFSPAVSGSRPFQFQWLRNGVEIPDATNETFRVSNLTTGHSGETYSVRVSNSAGSITSENATLTVQPDPARDLRAGLVNYWPLDAIVADGAELRSPDLYSGNDMVLVDFTGPTDVVEGRYSNALSFDFVSRLAYRTNGSPIYNHTNYSVAFWVKAPFETQNDRRVFSEGSSENNNPLFTIGTDISASSPSARIFIRGNAGENAELNGRASTQPVFDDTWRHVVWTDENGHGRLYVDGVLDETDFRYTRPPLTMDRTSLGAVLRAVSGNFYFGLMDEVVTWNRLLSWSEVQELMTNGVPPRISATAPTITVQPVSRTNQVFAGDIVSFSVQSAGSLPLSFQWFREGQPIPSAQNPSAATETLSLTNVQPSLDGQFYLVIANSAGSITSSVVNLRVAPYQPRTSGEVLKIDVGLNGSPNAQPGFDEFTLNLNGTNFNGVGVTFSSIGGAALADRNRTTGARITNEPPALTQAQIYNDFIFANSTTDGAGLRVTISRLAPNTPHELTLWSYDPQSVGTRVANWHETSSGNPIPIQEEYTFDGSIPPVMDFERTMTAILTSSPNGQLILEGTRNGGTSVAAFVNAIRLVASPGLSITRVALVNDRIRITVEALSPDQNIAIQQSANLPASNWSAAEGGTVVEQSGRTTVFEFPAAAPRMFYRAVTNP